MKDDMVMVNPHDFDSLGEKLQKLHASLTPNEANIFEWLMEAAGAGAGQAPPPPWLQAPHFKYKPRGAKMLVVGGSDGLTILISGRGHVTKVPPEGPLPTDRGGYVGALVVNGASNVVAGRG
jgi:hypothetical protein